ncbi:MAG: DUF362 domain-containing protein [Planctomycetaceae bacterium]|nr:DUF362 domain-containing protein [Planctomycetaceae bacterium]
MAGRFPSRGGKIYAVYGDDPAAMAKRLMEAAGVADSIPPGARVSLKPNLVVGRPASGGATTHPEILAGIIEFLQDTGHRNIEIIEGSWVGDDTGRAFAACGMAAVGKRYNVPLYDLKMDKAVAKDTPAGRINVCRRALDSDFLINLPVLKGHCQTRMTCALKNMKGCITDAEKRRFHRDGLDECIAALATAIIPHVTIVDGICGDLDFEEGGNPVQANRMLLGADPVKLDAYVCSLMGLSPDMVGYLPLAEEYGVGEMGIEERDIVHLNQPAPGVAAGKPTNKVQSLGRKLKADQACSACYANAIHAMKRVEEMGVSRTMPAIYIGQGWQGQDVDGIGIGRCARGKLGNVAGCPPAALDIVEAVREVCG